MPYVAGWCRKRANICHFIFATEKQWGFGCSLYRCKPHSSYSWTISTGYSVQQTMVFWTANSLYGGYIGNTAGVSPTPPCCGCTWLPRTHQPSLRVSGRRSRASVSWSGVSSGKDEAPVHTAHAVCGWMPTSTAFSATCGAGSGRPVDTVRECEWVVS